MKTPPSVNCRAKNSSCNGLQVFVHYRDALTLGTRRENGSELQTPNEIPAVELDCMISAARLALLEIENDACEYDDARHYYSRAGRTIGQMR